MQENSQNHKWPSPPSVDLTRPLSAAGFAPLVFVAVPENRQIPGLCAQYPHPKPWKKWRDMKGCRRYTVMGSVSVWLLTLLILVQWYHTKDPCRKYDVLGKMIVIPENHMDKSVHWQNQPAQWSMLFYPGLHHVKHEKRWKAWWAESHWQLQGAVPYRIQIVLEISGHGLKHAETPLEENSELKKTLTFARKWKWEEGPLTVDNCIASPSFRETSGKLFFSCPAVFR